MMGKRNPARNGSAIERGWLHLQEVIALTQLRIAEADHRIAKAEERMARAEERIVGHEERFDRIERMLAGIVRMLEELPDALKAKIGFSPAHP